MSTNRLQRTHRSTKIPNVKLRPAPAASRATERARADAEDDAHFQRLRDRGSTSGAHSAHDFATAQPLQGTVLSFTGLPDEKVRACTDQRELVEMAEQLGAQVHKNLTSEVTHLVARVPGSEKYRCAIRFPMHVVRPEWLHLVREAWLAGEDAVDVDWLAHETKLGAFEGMCIALSGVDEAARAHYAERIAAHGGTLAPRLVLDGSLTHLACGPDDGRARKSYTRVAEHQALARHGTDATLPPAVLAAARIRLVHAAWIDACCDAEALLPEDEFDAQRPLAPRPPPASAARPPVRRTASVPAVAPPPQHLQRLVHRIHSETEPGGRAEPRRAGLLALTRAERFVAERTLFASMTFHVAMHDDARTRRVASAIRSAGGVLTAAETAQYVVRPLCVADADARGGTLVTHHWIELCLHYDRIVPTSQLACIPTTAPMPVPGGDRLCISFTGLDRDGPQYHHAVAVVQALGGQVEDAFRRASTTHLVCVGDEAQNGLKAQKAHSWGIPTVGLTFLHDAFVTGNLAGGARAATPQEAPTPDVTTSPRKAAARSPRRAHTPPLAAPRPPAPTSPLAAWWAEPEEAPHVLYDDPAARKERTRLLALVDGPPPKKGRH